MLPFNNQNIIGLPVDENRAPSPASTIKLSEDSRPISPISTIILSSDGDETYDAEEVGS